MSLEGSAEILLVLGPALVPRTVGLGRLMLARVVGVDPGLGCIWSVSFMGATAACTGLSPACFLSASVGLMRGGSWSGSCGRRPGAQGPGSTLGPRGSLLICVCCMRSILLQHAAHR